MTAAAISGLAHYGEEAPRPPEMKCFRAKCPRTGTRTVTLYFYLRDGTVPATLTPMGVTLCAPCAAKAIVDDFVGDEGKGRSPKCLTEIDRCVGFLVKESLSSQTLLDSVFHEGTLDKIVVGAGRPARFAGLLGGIDHPESVGGHGVEAARISCLEFLQ